MISIVIATYNRARTLPQSLASCLAQTDKDIEIVVVDDGSTDDTEQVIKEQIKDDARIRYVKLDKNQGASVARNRGIQEAKGEWVMVWDSDDTLYSDAIAIIKKTISSHPDAVVVSAPTRMMKEEKEIPYSLLPEGFVSLEDVLCKKIGNNEKVRCARKEVYLKAPYVSRNIDFIVGARLRAQGEWFHFAQPLGDVYLDGSDSLTRTRKKFNRIRSAERAPYLKAYLVDFGETLRRFCSRRFAEISYGASIASACAGMKKDAIHFASSSIKTRPLSFRGYVAFLFAIFFPRC